MTIAIASDHAGFELKLELKNNLQAAGHLLLDHGPATNAAVDYPDFARAVARCVVAGEAERGVLVCGSGIGMAIAANRIPGARAVNVYDARVARLCREHNDCNIITLGGRFLDLPTAMEWIGIWMAEPFSAGRHQQRVNKIELPL